MPDPNTELWSSPESVPLPVTAPMDTSLPVSHIPTILTDPSASPQDRIAQGLSQGGVRVIAPDGTKGWVHHAGLQSFLKQNSDYRQAVIVTAPDGHPGAVAADQAGAFFKAHPDYLAGQPTPSAVPPEPGSFADLARGIPQPVLSAGSAINSARARMAQFGAERGQELLTAPVRALTSIQNPPPAADVSAPMGDEQRPPVRTEADLNALAEKQHPAASGILGGVGATAGGVAADPAMWPLMFSGGALPIVTRLAGMGFSAQMFYNALQAEPELRAAADQGDEAGVYRKLTEMGLGLYLGTKGAKPEIEHAVSTVQEKGPEVGQAIVQSKPGQLASRAVGTVQGWVKPAEALTAPEAITRAAVPKGKMKAVWREAVKDNPQTMGDVRRGADNLGVNVETMGPEEGLAAGIQAKKDIWQENQVNHPTEGGSADTSGVADRIRGTISQRSAEGQSGWVKDALDRAATYDQRDMPLSEIEDRVAELNNKTRGIEAMFPSDKRAAKLQPENKPIFAERDALRELLLQRLDEMTGPGARELRKRYGNVDVYVNAMSRRVEDLASKATDESELWKLGRIRSAGRVIRGLSTAGASVAAGQPLGAALGVGDMYSGVKQLQAQRMADLKRNPEWLIRKAFRETTPTPQADLSGPPRANIAGLLPSPPIPLGPVPEEPYTPPPPPPILRRGVRGLLPPITLPAEFPPPTNAVEAVGMPQTAEAQAIQSQFERNPQAFGKGVIPKAPSAEPPATESSPAVPTNIQRGVIPQVPPERRVNSVERKRISEMSPQEMQRELLTSPVTGMPNRRAFDEAQHTPAKAVAMSDADGLKAINDRFGYDAGNELLKAKAEALKEAGLEAYHEKGDEFLYRGASPEELSLKLENARSILRNREIAVTMKDGSVKRFKGADFSHGTGTDLAAAEQGLKAHKSEREALGERARGELRGITEVGPEQSQVNQGNAPQEAGTQEVAGPSEPKGLNAGTTSISANLPRTAIPKAPPLSREGEQGANRPGEVAGAQGSQPAAQKEVGKQPWQMTRKDAQKRYGRSGTPPSSSYTHKQEVQNALREGQPVPPEVLKDYPDLQNASLKANPEFGRAAEQIAPGRQLGTDEEVTRAIQATKPAELPKTAIPKAPSVKSDWQLLYEKALALQPENADSLRKMSGEQLRGVIETKATKPETKPAIPETKTGEPDIVTLPDGRKFPTYDGQTLSWNLSTDLADERAGSLKMRAVIRAMMQERPEQLARERQELVRGSFDGVFGANAKRALAVLDDEMGKAKPAEPAAPTRGVLPSAPKVGATAAKPKTGNPAVAARLRAVADRMDAQIDNARREMTQNPTPKRMAEYRSRIIEGDEMERTQKAMRALADAHEAGNVPPELAALRSKDEIARLVHKGLDSSKGGYYDRIPRQDYYDKSPTAQKLQEMIEGKTPQASAEKAAKEKASKISQLEAQVQFQRLPGYFPTPKSVIDKMLSRAGILPGQSVLEPSAGKGDIADAIRDSVPDAKIDTVEQQTKLAEILRLKGYPVEQSDFLEHKGQYDKIVMNPPFEKGADVDHVRHAYDLLKPGGRLVAIMSPHAEFASDAKSRAFREWLDTVGESEKLPESSFQKSGTGVNSRMVVIDKPGETKTEATQLSPEIQQAKDAALQRMREQGGLGVVGTEIARKPRGATALMNEVFNYGGELSTRADIIRDLQSKGQTQAQIDRYMQGLELGQKPKLPAPSRGVLPSAPKAMSENVAQAIRPAVIGQMREYGKQAASHMQAGDSAAAQRMEAQASRFVEAQPKEWRQAMLDAYNEARNAKPEWHNLDEKIVWRGKTITRSEAIAKEPASSDDILAARPAASYVPKTAKQPVPTKAQVTELEREYGATASRSTNPDVDLAVGRARARWQEAQKAYDAAQKSKRIQQEVKSANKQAEKVPPDADAMAVLNKMRTTIFGRGKIIEGLTQQQAKDVLAVKPQDRPVSLEDHEIQRLRDKAGVKEPTLQVRAENQIALGKTAKIEPPAAVPQQGKNFEGRYVKAALEPVKEAWLGIMENSDPAEENWKWMVKRMGEGADKPKQFQQGHVFIKVPDDGSFLIPNTPAAIDHALKAADHFQAPKGDTGKLRSARFKMPAPTEADTANYVKRLQGEIKEWEGVKASLDQAEEWQKDIANLESKSELSDKEKTELEDLKRQTWREQDLHKATRKEIEENLEVARETLKQLQEGKPPVPISDLRKPIWMKEAPEVSA